ncbi:MAG TPA: hypothetical protein VNH53_03035 [Sphingomicrobium sp.]|nr:hypothetical protein [Sphingomicrobium sp.]
MTDDRARALADFRRILKWIVLIAVLTVAAALAYLEMTGGLTLHLTVATIIGVFFTVLLGSGLFAAMYFSDKSGHDRSVTDATRRRSDD